VIPSNLGRTYHRPARALIGWIDPARAAQLLAANNQRPDLAANTVRDAHMAASLRKLSALPDGSTTGPSSPELARYLDEFRSRPEAQPYLAEGWEPQLVDLREARAFQPVVFTDRLPELCTSEDLVGLARVTLPPGRTRRCPLTSTKRRGPSASAGATRTSGSWVISSGPSTVRTALRASASCSTSSPPMSR
jgi:hypothetical protein